MTSKGENTIIYVMGVSGSGKSTIGQGLADALGLPFADGDDFHPPANVRKMKLGHPLNDEDRLGWLAAIAAFAKKQQAAKGAVIACSALKQKYREQLAQGISSVQWVYLEGDFELIRQRMQQRSNHFMPTALLQSQFDTLEAPVGAITVAISQPPEQIIADLAGQLL